MTPYYFDEHRNIQLFCDDSLNMLRSLPDASVDALVTDPPAGIGFMGKEFDTFKGDKRQWGDDNYHNNTADPFSRMRTRHGASAGYKNDIIAVRERFIAALTPIFAECMRVLKPGARGLVWALPRTSGWTQCALENAGFEIPIE